MIERIRGFLSAIGIALIAAAFLFYTDHPVLESNLYSPSVPGWLSVAIFLFIGVLGWITYVRDQKRDAENRKDEAPRQT